MADPQLTTSSHDTTPHLVEPLDAFNRQLLDNVHPPQWTNPQPADRYNLVVIGAGAGGLVSAIGAAMLGAKVAIVERALLGGDCLNVGCVPSKAIIACARAAADVRNADRFGVRVEGDTRVDFPAVMERMRRLRAQISRSDGVDRLREAGVDVFLGNAAFAGSESVEVNGARLRFSRAIVAAGGRPAVPDVPGLAEVGFRTNETLFWLTALPKRLAIVGGGPIGCEMAQAFARLGSEVHLIQSAERIMERDDPDAAQIVDQALRRDGVRIGTSCRLTSVRREGSTKVLSISCEGDDAEIEVDEILLATGRRPNVERLGLERAGVQFDSKEGIQVDDFLRTSNSRIYAVGDICSKLKFTHLSDAHARMAIQNALFFGRKRVSRLIVPWCTYTDPEVARVGMDEPQARDAGYDIETIRIDLADVDRAILEGDDEGFLKVIAKKGSGKILGATLVARHAGDMISEVTLAMQSGAGLGELAKTIHPYPTTAEVIRKAADAQFLSRFSPTIKRLLRMYLRWRR